MIEIIKRAFINTMIVCFGIGAISLFLLILFTFLMDGKVICATGLIMLIVFVICLIQGYSERKDK